MDIKDIKVGDIIYYQQLPGRPLETHKVVELRMNKNKPTVCVRYAEDGGHRSLITEKEYDELRENGRLITDKEARTNFSDEELFQAELAGDTPQLITKYLENKAKAFDAHLIHKSTLPYAPDE